MRRKVAIALAAAAVIVGVWVGLWESHFWVTSVGCPLQTPFDAVRCAPPVAETQFARWLCALCGAGAAALIALIALAVDRWPEAAYSN